MSKNKDKKPPKNKLSSSGWDGEGDLWTAYTKDIAPLKKSGHVQKLQNEGVPKITAKPKKDVAHPPVKTIQAQAGSNETDFRTDQKLRRGQIPIDAVLDLHGDTQGEAHTRLNKFLLASHRAGHRCALVITGKGGRRTGENGERETGVLRQKFPAWVADHPLRDIVLKTATAQPKHGGSGAFYVYLRRTRAHK